MFRQKRQILCSFFLYKSLKCARFFTSMYWLAIPSLIPRHQADYSQHTRCDFARDLFTGVVTNISLSCKWLDLYWRASAVFMIPTGATNTLHTTQTVGGRNAKKVNFYCLLVWGISRKSQPSFFGNKIAWFFRRLQKCVVMLIWSLLRFPLFGIYEHKTNKCVFWYLCI